MANGNKLNGSVDLLAQAMQKVFQESMNSTREAVKGEVRDEIQKSESRILKHVDERVDKLKGEVPELVADVIAKRNPNLFPHS